eukprot:12909795-Prorocentrum_lima.AAC.1
MLSAYQHHVRPCQQEGNQGNQHPQMEVAALQGMNNFQSEELNAQRGMVNGLIHHMEQHVGSS